MSVNKEPTKYVTRSNGKIEVYFNKNLIFKRTYRSIKQRTNIMGYYKMVFHGYAESVYFQVSYKM